MSTVFKHQYATSHLQGADSTYVEWLYEQYLAEPGSVPPEWRQYFSTLAGAGAEVPHGPIVQAVAERLRQRIVNSMAPVTDTEVEILLASQDLSGGEYNISHIMVQLPDGATPQQIQEAEAKAQAG